MKEEAHWQYGNNDKKIYEQLEDQIRKKKENKTTSFLHRILGSRKNA
jgi:hypothetical protein